MSAQPAPLPNISYLQRRGQIETYFDRTAADAWARLTSEAPVGRIRATVRAGRDSMRRTLMSWLPTDLRGARVLDAGCGTGALSVEAARRGARVTAVDLSPTLVKLAAERLPHRLGEGSVEFVVGDLLDPTLGSFDYVVAMDSLIHYRAGDAVRTLAALSLRTSGALLFTFAPRTPLLALMHRAGKLFPRGDRSPAIEPVAPDALRAALAAEPVLAGFRPQREARVARGFYISQALELAGR
jgi:magnesium-protoporphyrin O-methyltransferase